MDYVYLWADGIHVNIRLEEHKLCLLVLIGVRADGRKELVALADGYRESTESWADLLRDCARRGMRAPVLAVGDGALGFWGALREVFPPGPGAALLVPQDRQRARRAAEVRASRGEEGAGRDLERRGPPPRPRRRDRRSRPPTGRSSPRPSRRSPTTSTSCSRSTTTPPSTGSTCAPRTPSSRTFATVRHRTKVTRGPGSRAAGLAMAFKLIEAAQDRWRAVNGPHLVALVRAGATFVNGKLVERPDEHSSTRSRLKDLHPQVLTIAQVLIVDGQRAACVLEVACSPDNGDGDRMVSSQGVAPVDHAVWGGIQGLAVSASRMASVGRRPWLRALTR